MLYCIRRSEIHLNLANPVVRIEGYIQAYKFYHTIVALCNIIFSRVLFSAQIMTLTCAIFGTYFVLTYWKSSSIALLMFFVILSLQSVSFFVISCEKLFDVPNKLRAHKRTLFSFVASGQEDDERGREAVSLWNRGAGHCWDK